ncbi:hypothetical protein IT575_11595 [bacterium]|nr:hypothetical protein [bacterium]
MSFITGDAAKQRLIPLLLLGALLLLPLAGHGQEAAPPEQGEPAAAGDASAPGTAAEAPPPLELEPLSSPPAAASVSSAAVEDVPNDNGQALGVSFDWAEPAAEGVTVSVELKPDSAILEEFKLSDAEQARLDSAREKLKSDLGSLIADRDAKALEVAAADEARTAAKNVITQTKDYAGLAELERAYWKAKSEMDSLQDRIDGVQNRFAARGGRKLLEKQRKYEYLSAALAAEWLPTDIAGVPAAEVDSRGAHAPLYGREPDNAEQPWLMVSQILAPLPEALAAQAEELHSSYGEDLAPGIPFPLKNGQQYQVRLAFSGPEGSSPALVDAGPGTPRQSFFKSTLASHFIIATLYALIILSAIMLARRNPNLFIRRIAGLEAVDEAIGRATEMGKPVLYLNGMDALSELSTLSAINILGRVSRRIADFDSDLLVPCRDPVVFSVAQEVVKQGYAEQGRPDAFRASNIYFVTDDQFSYTASVCAIMIRERPAANFFMGYYYAESLLLAETGASTGAIQIAGTDSPNQLPFFITTCDYTLIGEELYAASAYLSREPLLLGSLKGQDVGKALMMLLILLQTILFVAQFATGNAAGEPWDWLVKMVEPL